MRPKKRVLLYCLDDLRGAQVALVLRTRGFAVSQVQCLPLLGHALDFSPPFDGALVLDSGELDHGEAAVEAVQRHAMRAPVLLQLGRQMPAVTSAERCLAHGAGMDELVEAVRMLASRKRGPKGPRALPVGTQRAIAAAGKAAVA